MNIKIKNNAYKLLFPAAFLIVCAFCHALPVRAALSEVTVYYLITSDRTPLIKGTVDDPSCTVQVTVNGHTYDADISGDGSWSAEVTTELNYETDYRVDVTATQGGNHFDVSLDPGVIVVPGYPMSLYVQMNGETGEVSEIIFADEQTFDLGGFTLSFQANTSVTRTEGGTYDINDWMAEMSESENDLILKEIRFGIPGVDLSFSKTITIGIVVGDSYDGQTLHIFSREDTSESGWEPIDTCVVADGVCSFGIDHASYFAASEQDSIAEGEENNAENQDAYIASWKAYQYENNSGVACPVKLKLTIKGKHFDKDAEVRIGGKKASSVNVKNSKNLTAKFCLSKLLDVQTDHKRVVSVTNPDTDRGEANKKINLDNIGYNMSTEDFNSQTTEGVKNIQTALVQLGFLDKQYITGIYGLITTEAVRKFQEQNGLPATGFFGPLSEAKLQEKME